MEGVWINYNKKVKPKIRGREECTEPATTISQSPDKSYIFDLLITRRNAEKEVPARRTEDKIMVDQDS